MEVSPQAMSSVTFTLLDALLNQLIDKGVLTQDDQVAIYQRAHASLTSAADDQMRNAAALLEHLYKDPVHHDAFLASLPIAGKDGTLAARLRQTRAEGNALAKTGSIANVRALSGFVKTRDGETLVFSILANDFVIPSATINWIADLAVEILANFSRSR